MGGLQPESYGSRPSFDEELNRFASLNFSLDFVQITRYAFGASTFILVDKKEPPQKTYPTPSERRGYGWEWYSKNFKSGEVEVARSLFDQIQKFVVENKMDLEPKFNKWYISFKYGGSNAFVLEWRHAGKVSLGVMVRDPANDPSNRSGVKWNWDKIWEYWYTEIDSTSFELKSIENVLKEAYDSVVSRR